MSNTYEITLKSLKMNNVNPVKQGDYSNVLSFVLTNPVGAGDLVTTKNMKLNDNETIDFVNSIRNGKALSAVDKFVYHDRLLFKTSVIGTTQLGVIITSKLDTPEIFKLLSDVFGVVLETGISVVTAGISNLFMSKLVSGVGSVLGGKIKLKDADALIIGQGSLEITGTSSFEKKIPLYVPKNIDRLIDENTDEELSYSPRYERNLTAGIKKELALKMGDENGELIVDIKVISG
ncbi:MAG: hypothetical protein HQL06_15760 [Nitrospirae bacterium]|nr:hypothetical protein [Nitrospirota bacterium]